MSTLDEQEKGYENKFAHDQEVDFKIRCRRNKLLGFWAAEKMHMDEDESAAYAESVLKNTVDGVPNDTVRNKVFEDLIEKGVNISEADIKKEMDNLLLVARDEFK